MHDFDVFIYLGICFFFCKVPVIIPLLRYWVFYLSDKIHYRQPPNLFTNEKKNYYCPLIWQTYMAPWISIFGDFTKDPQAMYNNFRVYGTGLLLIMGMVVFVGVKFVNKFATIALACVILSITAVYVGIFVNFYGNDKLQWVYI